MNFDDALTYLLSLGHETLTIKLGLENTYTLLGALGNPQKQFPSVQIAGTNGKGSTAVMLESICRAAGIRVGLFTSPHLISITERIRVDGKEISESDFAKLTQRVRAAAENLLSHGRLETVPTFFEHITAIALLFFREARVELAILETGLGGRLDSTTAAGAEIVAITPVAMDHEEYLGHTLAEIAAEKAAIIRPGVTAIVGPQAPDAFEVINRRCAAVGVAPKIAGQDEIEMTAGNSADGRFGFTIETKTDRYENVWLRLRGRHQVTNAAVAIAMAESLREHGIAVPKVAITLGIESATHRGRLELSEGPPRILFDGAHNPAAAHSLRDYLTEFVTVPITMIFGAMGDKDLAQMAATLFPLAEKLILTEFDNPRAATIGSLRASLPSSLDQRRLHQASSVIEAWQIAQQLSPPDGLICVTGSLYLVGALQEHLRHSSRVVARQQAAH